MSVSKTNRLLREFVKERKEVSKEHYFQLQRDLLCEPIAEYFEEFHATQLHKYFLENGMFYPDAKIFSEIKQLEKKQVWELLQGHYEKLRKEWNGEEAEIFIFPAERRNEIIMKELKGKMGISFHHVVVLFLTRELSTKEIKALLTHEYNHVCRLFTLQKEFHELSLLDSMIIEGLAEVAVEQTLGEELLAPWVTLYTKKDLIPYWCKVKKYLDVKGKEKHDPFLYGDRSGRGFPKWFGYCTGYLIVKDYLEKHKDISMNELLKIETKEILSESGFDPETK
ncbi:DUF2268 domain-containing protein [Anaerobacillus isosaccharinicus]|uniref:DUF2268 domain-containing protein n=1 Tax=Anaerobacillus isosaccharinicus TaxID=1532552 RepID=A0A1S2L769_9BACI|nr:DUF2268 domain-containing protein [Anaerobacillus isosaccharinicus]MBA5587663.1 DUF2268 domain-containing protein [Anaerobacillus isosaccharinicus]QOY34165.1 DUF2268 domain-containing protein [Anaerobacillus isosaccharinicus]